MNAPELSVILVTRDTFDVLRTTMRHLRAQTARDRIEVLIAAPCAAPMDDADRDGLAAVRIVEVGPITTLAAAQAQAIQQAAAPVIVCGEDHSFPAPDWADKIIAAHRGPHVAVAPIIVNANPHSLMSCADYFLSFGRWTDASVAGETDYLPWHNTSYKRDLLLQCGEQLPFMLAVEGLLHAELRAQGHRLYLLPDTHTRHINFSRFWPWMVAAVTGGRLFAAARAGHCRWSAGKRLMYALATPLIPFVRLYRIIQQIRALPQQRHQLPRLIPLLGVGLVAHALGEMFGNLFGTGRAEEKYLDYETGRIRYVNARDYRELAAT